MGKNVVNQIDDQVRIDTMLVSVSDKTGLDEFIPGVVALNPKILILSTGGTYARISEILDERAEDHLRQVSDYTGQPETQGGLVKTLDFKIYLGLLTETYNEAHQGDLKRTRARAIDMVVVNLYPFSQTIAKVDATPENARGNIDIGGPTMIRASAKNFIRVASVVDPGSYPRLLEKLEKGKGALSLSDRFELARKAFEHTAQYDRAIADYLAGQSFDKIQSCYA
ncbi:IMP cyclohydrolase [Desulfospira joergensenii]|uniref:IMP cyclohydrolase n=1 Tax=Desulfospira joergensenii TaxID=53329 RepID=UPI0003B5EE4C|nr:IMP cyclohydrolase [Desulfospira joergensenii]